MYPKKFQVVEHPYIFLNKLEWNNKLAVAVSTELSFSRVKTENSQIFHQMDFYCFDQPNIIYKYSLKMLTRKSFPYLNELNDFIQRASDGGLIVKWLSN